MAEQRSSVKTDHALDVLSHFDKLRSQGIACDFTLKVRSAGFPVHRAVLLACSEYFRMQNDLDLPGGFVEINEVSVEGAEHCVKFMYTGEADINFQNIQNVLAASMVMKLSGLTELCFGYLVANLNASNCLLLIDLARVYNQPDLEAKARLYVVDNFRAVISSTTFQEISEVDILSYISESKEDYSILWKGLLVWLRGKSDEQAVKLLPVLVKNLDITKFPLTFIVDTIMEEPIVNNSEVVKKMMVGRVFEDLENLAKNMNVRNCFKLKQLAKEYQVQDKAVIEAINDFIVSNLEEFVDRGKLQTLDEREFLEIFEMSKEKEDVEETLRWSVMSEWVHGNLKRRKHIFPLLFMSLSLEKLPYGYFQDFVKNDALVKESSVCLSLVKGMDESSHDEIKIASLKAKHIFKSCAKGFLAKDLSELRVDDVLRFFREEKPSFETYWIAVVAWVACGDEEMAEKLPLFTSSVKWTKNEFSFMWDCFTKGADERFTKELKDSVFATFKTSIKEGSSDINIDDYYRLKMLNKVGGGAGEDDVSSIIERHLAIHFEEAFQRPGFLKLSEKYLTKLLKSADTKCSEKLKWRAILKWVKHDPDRVGCFPNLFQLLNIKKMGVNFIQSTVRSEPLVNEFRSCVRILNSVGFAFSQGIGGDEENAHFFLIGGKVFLFDAENRKLTAFSKQAVEADSHLVVASDTVYICGKSCIFRLEEDGELTKMTSTTKYWQEDMQIVAFQKQIFFMTDFETAVYAPELGQWSEDLPACNLSIGFCVAASDEYIYAMGGVNTGSKAVRYDPKSRSWSKIARMARPRCDGAAAVMNGRVYVIGDTTNSVDCYDPVTDNWTTLVKMIKPRTESTAYALGGKIFVVGRTPSQKTVNSIEVYSEDTNQWKLVDLPDPKGVISACALPYKLWITDTEAQELAEYIETEFSRKLEEKATTTKKIGPDGGEINLFGCTIKFPRDALNKEVEFTMSVDTNPDNAPDGLVPISPTLGCEPSMTFNLPATVTMKTRFSAAGSKEIPVVISRRDEESHWRKIQTIIMGTENTIQFDVNHFSDVNGSITEDTVNTVKYHLCNDVYIHKNTALIASVFSHYQKDQAAFKEFLDAKDLVKFLPLTKEIRKEMGTEIKLEIECEEPLDTRVSRAMPSDIFTITKEFLENKKYEVYFRLVPRPIQYEGVISGNYTIKILDEDPHTLPLEVVWPVPADTSGEITNILHFHAPVQQVVAGVADGGNNQVL